MSGYTYILRCADGTLYCGWTNDLTARLAAHNSGKGAKYTRGRGPVTLAYSERFDTQGEAMRREAEIKKLPRPRKQALIDAGWRLRHPACFPAAATASSTAAARETALTMSWPSLSSPGSTASRPSAPAVRSRTWRSSRWRTLRPRTKTPAT